MNNDNNVDDPRDRPAGGPPPEAETTGKVRTDAPPPGADAAPPRTEPLPPRRLVRYPEEGPVAGVATGLGSYFGIDPVLFRIAFVVLTFAGGSGILLYLISWAVIPEAPAGSVPGTEAASADDRTLQWAGAGLIVVAALWLTAQLDIVSVPVLWALALIVVGILLFRGDLTGSFPARRDPVAGEGAAAGTQDPPPPPPAWQAAPPPPPAWQAAPPPPPAWQAAPSPSPSPSPPPSVLGRLALGVALVVGGGAALLDNAGLLHLSFRHYVALALVVLGLTLVLGAWWGRGRGLIWIGVLLIPLVVFASLADAFWNVRGGVGERFYAPVSTAEVPDRYELFAGELQIDLSDVDLPEGSHDVRASVTFGELVVVVPPRAAVEVDARVGGGEVILPAEAASGDGFAAGRAATGMRVQRRAELEGEPGGGALSLDLSTGFGTVIVRRAQ